MQLAEESGGAGAEVDHGHAGRADALDHGPRVRRGEAHVIVRSHRSDPTVEHLNRAGAGRHLQCREWSDHVHDLAHQPPPQRLIAIHHLLGADECSRRAAFDHVARHGERRAHESDHRHLAGEPLDYGLDRFGYVSQIVRVRRRQRVHVGRETHGIVDDRPDAVGEPQLQPHRLDGEQQVGENDGRVHVQDLHRLQGHGSREVRPLAHFQHPVLRTDIAVLFQIPPGLTHEPDGSYIRRPAAARVEKTAVH